MGAQHYNQFSLMTDYYLSKRTDIYAGVVWQHEQSPDRGACGDASRVLTGRKK